MCVIGVVVILGVLVGLHQIVTYQAEIAFEEFDSKQKSIDSNVLQPIPKPTLKNKTIAEKEK
ncbi:hypothetical protein YTPLAS73_10250 [Nitrosarchaeum sp.]|nr:hypothetical protein YTPLAS73_10250 [Nitrosarchaeum sp.]